jgi:hypothetical protein
MRIPLNLEPLLPMKNTYIRLIAGVCVLACTLAQTPVRRIANLRLQVTDSHGDPVKDWEVTKLVDISGRDWRRSVGRKGIAQIPPGEYVIGVDQHSFLPFEGHLSMREPTTHFVAGLLFGGIEDTAGQDDVLGRFEAPPGVDSWCKLAGLYTGSGHFTPVDADGRFRFVLVPSERYALVCWRGSATLEARIIDTKAGSNQEIIIPARGKPAE